MTNVCAREDTTCIVNGFVFEVDTNHPLADVNIRWYQFDTLGTVIAIDSVFTDAEGEFSVSIPKGLYNFYTILENYRGCLSHTDLELTDSLYTLEFALYHPVLSLDRDSLFIAVDSENSVQGEIIVQNIGSGKLSYNYILYLRKEIPEDLTLINEGGVCTTFPDVYYGAPAEEDWKCLVQDRQDQGSGQHDIKSVMTQMIEGTFYLRIDFYEALGPFSELDVEFWLDTDPAENTGHPDVGFEYLIYINGESGMLMAPLLDYANGNYNLMSDPVYTDIHQENNYLVVGYPSVYLCRYEVILTTAYTRAGSDETFYADWAPDPGTGNMLFSVKSNPFLALDAFYGEASGTSADTIILNVSPGILNDTLDNFFIGIVSEDEAVPITIVPVQLQRPPTVDHLNEVPDAGTVFNICPNPATSELTIQYTLDETAEVMLQVFDLRGNRVKLLYKGVEKAGEHRINWNITSDPGTGVSPGIYYCELLINGHACYKKLIIAR